MSHESAGNPLGDFLRARRERVDPQTLGLRTLGPRRTPGLRREEVAASAGISVEYLIRLERGRDRHPSPDVVNALAEVLGLDEGGRGHLAALAEVRLEPAYDDLAAAPEVVSLISRWPHPTIVMNRFMDLLAINEAGAPLHEGLGLRPGDNMLRRVFLDARTERLYPDFEEIMAEAVGTLRGLSGHDPHHPRLIALVGELSVSDHRFAELWASGEVVAKTTGTKRIDLAVGRLTMRWDTLSIAAAPGQLIVAYQAVEDTGTDELLARLEAERRAG